MMNFDSNSIPFYLVFTLLSLAQFILQQFSSFLRFTDKTFSATMERRSVVEPELGQPRNTNLVTPNRAPPSTMACLHKLRKSFPFEGIFSNLTSSGDLWETKVAQSSLLSWI